MVDELAEAALELVWGAVEGALDWLGGDDRRETDAAHAGRYAEPLYEERGDPPGSPQDPNR